MEYNGTLSADPGADRGAVLVVMTPARLTLFAATPWPPSERLGPALLGLAFIPSDVIELIRLNRAFQLTISFIGESSIPEPPAPAIAGVARDTQLSSNAPG